MELGKKFNQKVVFDLCNFETIATGGTGKPRRPWLPCSFLYWASPRQMFAATGSAPRARSTLLPLTAFQVRGPGASGAVNAAHDRVCYGAICEPSPQRTASRQFRSFLLVMLPYSSAPSCLMQIHGARGCFSPPVWCQ